MAEIPGKASVRTAQIAAIPMSHLGRRFVGLGKQIAGQEAADVRSQAQLKTADQMFRTLGNLKGGAMKMGQALSIFEAALPEEFTSPYRQSLTKLQDSAPPMAHEQVLSQLDKYLGTSWRQKFLEFYDAPVGAASIGQVHRGVWHDGREVAVKIQYPGAGPAIMADLNQISRMGRLFGAAFPGLDIKELVAELKLRVAEELDYIHESQIQRKFAVAFDGHPDYFVPHVLSASEGVIVTEWIEGHSLAQVIASGTQDERNHFGQLYLRFLLSGPQIAGYMHADPHPGNFKVMADGRLAVLDFGAAAQLPDGLPTAMGRLLRIAMAGDSESVLTGLRAEGFIKPGINVDPAALIDYLAPFTEPAKADSFAHSREWLKELFEKTADPRNADWTMGLKINLPPSYLLIHRTWLGSIGVLCQLGAQFSVRAEFEKWIPEFAEPARSDA